MHLLQPETHSLTQSERAQDLGQTPGDVVFLSFSDSDLAAVAQAWQSAPRGAATLRLANIKRLAHPYSVDLYVEKTIAKARLVLVRLLGGLDYWRYGIDEIAAACRSHGIKLAIVPGDHMPDARLDAASTLPQNALDRLWRCFQEGGPDNIRAALDFMLHQLDGRTPYAQPLPVAAFGVIAQACHMQNTPAALALIVCYRSHYMAADIAPVIALKTALAARGMNVSSVFVTNLKDPQALAPLRAHLAACRPDVILNATAFAARLGTEPGALEAADAPVLQVILANTGRDSWQASTRGLNAADLAMHVVLPEVDGRIITRAISFKQAAEPVAELEHAQLLHCAEPSRIAQVADLAAGWARLRHTPRGARRLALVMSDYPAKSGRAGYAVGLDTPASVRAVLDDLAAAGFAAGGLAALDDLALMQRLTGEANAHLPLAAYENLFATLPQTFRAAVTAAWGAPADDPACDARGFALRVLQSGNISVALQPDRAGGVARGGSYHDASLPPRHAYIAFYLWLRHAQNIDAMIHCGAHGTLEWLPGKSVALDADCAPEVLTGALPVIYPFIVNNPGEAAQARRRLAAVTIGHLTPPLMQAGAHGAAAEIEALLDEYASAAELDPARAKLLAQQILARAGETGFLKDSGAPNAANETAALAALDAFICDIKEMRIGDGLHVFGRASAVDEERMLDALAAPDAPARGALRGLLNACARAESTALIAALDGRFVEPGPSGAPSALRLDVLPTGRNLFASDPRALPTRAAFELGQASALALLARHTQDHGDWLKSVVLDLWGSAAMRTGGHDLAEAFALMGVRPVWDSASTRVSGFEITPLAVLGRPRVDVTLRISGLFRDSFPMQMDLFAAAVRALAALDETAEDNPLIAAHGGSAAAPLRMFGAAPGGYGLGLTRQLSESAWQDRMELAQTYLAANSHAFADGDTALPAAALFRERVASADAYVHSEDLHGQDALSADAIGEHAGGFAAAAQVLGAAPALYTTDLRNGGAAKVRSLDENLARVIRGRATNPAWLAGQMRHGWRGAAEIAETVDNFFAFAALTDSVAQHQFDLLCDAICGDAAVRDFLVAANPQAARAIAGKFEEAVTRGLWQARRNSTAALLADMREACA